MDDSLFESSTVKTKITNYEKDIKDTTCTYPQLDVLIKKISIKMKSLNTSLSKQNMIQEIIKILKKQ